MSIVTKTFNDQDWQLVPKKMTTDIIERLRAGHWTNVPWEPEYKIPPTELELEAANEIEQLRLRCNASKELGAPALDEPVAWMMQYEGQCMGFVPDQEPNTVPVYLHPPRKFDSGCQLEVLGRGDCEHAIGLPGIPITGQHDGEDTTVDANGKPNGWCWYCWQAHQIKELRKPRKFDEAKFRNWAIKQGFNTTEYTAAYAAAKWMAEQ